MCLAVPMRVVEVEGNGGTAVVEAGGFSCRTDVSLVEDIQTGDYLIVHAGFAIEKLDAEEADIRIKLFDELAEKTGGGIPRASSK